MSAGVFRALPIVLLTGCLLVLPGIGLLAQEAPEPDADAPAAVTVDAHTLAEQAIVFGDDAAGMGLPPPVTSPFGIFRVVLTLALVAAAIYGVVFLLKKASRGGRVSQDPFLKVLAAVPIGTNRSVHVVTLGSQAWLVGSAEHGVNLISEITDKETLDAMILEDSRRSVDSVAGRFPDFKSMLRRFGMPTDSGAPSPENIRKRSERLKGI